MKMTISKIDMKTAPWAHHCHNCEKTGRQLYQLSIRAQFKHCQQGITAYLCFECMYEETKRNIGEAVAVRNDYFAADLSDQPRDDTVNVFEEG